MDTASTALPLGTPVRVPRPLLLANVALLIIGLAFF
jgi:hypothetical protein